MKNKETLNVIIDLKSHYEKLFTDEVKNSDTYTRLSVYDVAALDEMEQEFVRLTGNFTAIIDEYSFKIKNDPYFIPCIKYLEDELIKIEKLLLEIEWK